MKMKLLVSAATISLPLIFSGAYAQTATSTESGNNRSAQSGAMTTNPTPKPNTGVGADGKSGSTPGTSGAAVPDASGSRGATSTTPDGTTGATGKTGAMGASTTTSPTAPGTEKQPDSAAATTEAITGWSAKDDLMGKSVFNENDEKIGDISDVVISSDGRTLYLLVGAGGFLGMGSKNVAVPFDRFERRDDRILLSGYTKEQLKALPEVRTER